MRGTRTANTASEPCAGAGGAVAVAVAVVASLGMIAARRAA